MSAAVAPTRLLVAAYPSRKPWSARRMSRTARWLRSESEPSTMTYVLVPARRCGSLKAHLSGMPRSPRGLNPSPVRACAAAAASCPATTMSQSMTGLAARPGTDVLPTCSMASTGTPAAAIASAYSCRSFSNRPGHAGSYSTTRITPANLVERELDGGRGSGGHVPDEALGRQAAKQPEEPVALRDLLRGGRGEEVPAAEGLLLAAGDVGAEQPL